jgi:hypothetical protein
VERAAVIDVLGAEQSEGSIMPDKHRVHTVRYSDLPHVVFA